METELSASAAARQEITGLCLHGTEGVFCRELLFVDKLTIHILRIGYVFLVKKVWEIEIHFC